VDPAVLEASVPHLVLQPLLENAIRHGIATSATAGAVTVEARRDDATLHLTVHDDGPGMEGRSQTPDGWGVGLANIQGRLARLYGDHAGLEVANGERGGASAHVFLPYRPAPTE
jgi:LytS/YehU family sensor histidine kinase